MSIRTAALLLVAFANGCAGAASNAFQPTFPDNQPKDVEQVLGRLQAAAPAPQPQVGVGVTKDPDRLYAFDLESGKKQWQRPAKPHTAPQIAGELVVTREPTGVIARRLQDGKRLFTVDNQTLHLAGASGEGSSAVIALSTGGGVGAHSKLVVVTEQEIAWEAEVDHAIGAPAVRAGMIFVPWANQNVSVLDVQSGEELARIRLDTVAGHALVRGGSLYFGQRGLFRLTPSIRTGSKSQAAYAEPSLGDLPGNPSFLPNAYDPPPSPESGVHRIQLAWHPAGRGEEVTVAHDTAYLIFYKLVFALDARNGEVKWVHSHRSDIVGARAHGSGLLVADQKGKVQWLGAEHGHVRGSKEIGARPVFVRLPAEPRAPEGSPAAETQPLRDQLLQAAEVNDSRVLPARIFAVEQLSNLDAPEVTASLIALCDDQSRSPKELRETACQALTRRAVGAKHVLSALDRHASFLQNTGAPPVGALALAAVRMEEDQAVPKLISHLRDPETPADDLAPLLAALEQLGDRAAVEPIRDFLRLYHADRPSTALVKALGRAAHALVGLQGPVATETLEQVAEDPLAIPEVRDHARRALASLRQEQKDDDGDGKQRDKEPQDPEAGSAEEADQAETPGDEGSGRAPHITNADLERVLGPVKGKLKQCLRDDPKHPRSARIVILVEGNGRVRTVSVNPDRLQSCVAPLVRSRDFPTTQGRRPEQLIYTLRR
jgi:outer membrane protein assembly factor BamB